MMLCLKRNVGDKIQIGDNIVITINDVGNGWVKVGIDAPKDIQILRDDAKQTQPRKESA